MARYTIVLDPDEESGGYTVLVPALPGCVSQGETVEEAVDHAREAIAGYVEALRAAGEQVPVERAHPELRVVEIAV